MSLAVLDWRTYAEFHTESVACNEIDDVYPCLKEFGEILELDPEQAVWLTFLYVAYYNMNSTLQVFEKHRQPAVPEADQLKLPTGTERRAHRVPAKLERHLGELVSIAENNGGLLNWIRKYVVHDSPTQSWDRVVVALESIYGNGRWASYKTAEMLWKVNGLPLQASDMGHAHSSGPRKGLALLYKDLPDGNNLEDVAELDRISLDLLDKLTNLGVDAKIEEAETSLCDVYALAKGHYYMGMDIDAMLENLLKCPSPLAEQMFEARKRVIPHHYLGELNGWTGVDQNRKRVFKETGMLLLRSPE
jgi:hypothetical protein